MYDIGSIYLASDIQDAVAALNNNPVAEIISGGTDVLIKVRAGKQAGTELVSIAGIQALKGIERDGAGTIVIKPGTVFSHIVDNEIIRAYLPYLAEACDQVGGPQIRNMGTIGGNICNGVTSADSASVLYTLNAEMELTGAEGVRYVRMADWYQGPGRTVRKRNEVLTAIRIFQSEYEGFYGHYMKYGKRNAMEIAVLCCAALVKLSQDKTKVEELRMGYGVAGPNPLRCHKTEALAAGRVLNQELLDLVRKSVLDEVNPRSSFRASKEFRLQLIEELAERTLREAIGQAGGCHKCLKL